MLTALTILAGAHLVLVTAALATAATSRLAWSRADKIAATAGLSTGSALAILVLAWTVGR